MDSLAGRLGGRFGWEVGWTVWLGMGGGWLGVCLGDLAGLLNNPQPSHLAKHLSSWGFGELDVLVAGRSHFGLCSRLYSHLKLGTGWGEWGGG